MNWLEILVLALVQGLTEFLPVSSSAHLILVPILFGWQDQGHAFDVAVHVGTLTAMVGYFRRELSSMLCALAQAQHPESAQARQMALWLIVATLPILFAGVYAYAAVSDILRNTMVIAVTTLGFGVLLWLADVSGSRTRTEQQLRMSDALYIGAAQCLALIPGVSRAGIVMTMALALGLQRTAAAHVAFLLAIPTIAGAGVLSVHNTLQMPQPADWVALLFGALVAGVSAWLCIHFFLRLIERIGMLPFVLYRLVLGGVILFLFV